MNQHTTDAAGMIISQVISGGGEAAVNMGTNVLSLVSLIADLAGTFGILFTLYIGLVASREDLEWEWQPDFVIKSLGICLIGTLVGYGVEDTIGTLFKVKLRIATGSLIVFAMTTHNIRDAILSVIKPAVNLIIALASRKVITDEDLDYKGAAHTDEHDENTRVHKGTGRRDTESSRRDQGDSGEAGLDSKRNE